MLLAKHAEEEKMNAEKLIPCRPEFYFTVAEYEKLVKLATTYTLTDSGSLESKILAAIAVDGQHRYHEIKALVGDGPSSVERSDGLAAGSGARP